MGHFFHFTFRCRRIHCTVIFFGNSYFRYSNIKTVLNRLKNNFKMLKLALVAAVLVHVVASNVMDINVEHIDENTPDKDVGWPRPGGQGGQTCGNGQPGKNCCGTTCCSPNVCKMVSGNCVCGPGLPPGCISCCGTPCCSPLQCRAGCLCTCARGGYVPFTLNPVQY